jgi:hypothetical protein
VQCWIRDAFDYTAAQRKPPHHFRDAGAPVQGAGADRRRHALLLRDLHYVLIEARRAAWQYSGDAAASLAMSIESDLVHNIDTLNLSLQAVINSLKQPELAPGSVRSSARSCCSTAPAPRGTSARSC